MFFIKDNQGVNVDQERWKPLPTELAESVEMGLFRSPGWPYGAFPRGFAARHAGEYRVRFSARAVLQHPGFRVSDARHAVPMTFRSRRPTNHDIAEDMKTVGGILEIQPQVHVYETTVPLVAGQTVEYGLLGLPNPAVDAAGKTGVIPLPAAAARGPAWSSVPVDRDRRAAAAVRVASSEPPGSFRRTRSVSVTSRAQAGSQPSAAAISALGGTTPGAGGGSATI